VCHTITEDLEEHEEWTIKKLHMYNRTRRGVSITCIGECFTGLSVTNQPIKPITEMIRYYEQQKCPRRTQIPQIRQSNDTGKEKHM